MTTPPVQESLTVALGVERQRLALATANVARRREARDRAMLSALDASVSERSAATAAGVSSSYPSKVKRELRGRTRWSALYTADQAHGDEPGRIDTHRGRTALLDRAVEAARAEVDERLLLSFVDQNGTAVPVDAVNPDDIRKVAVLAIRALARTGMLPGELLPPVPSASRAARPAASPGM